MKSFEAANLIIQLKRFTIFIDGDAPLGDLQCLLCY